jgi:hypothetical protein
MQLLRRASLFFRSWRVWRSEGRSACSSFMIFSSELCYVILRVVMRLWYLRLTCSSLRLAYSSLKVVCSREW